MSEDSETLQQLIRQRGDRISSIPLRTPRPEPEYTREVAARVEYDPTSDLVEIRIVANLDYAEVMLETAQVQLRELKKQQQRQKPSAPIPPAKTPPRTPQDVLHEWRLF